MPEKKETAILVRPRIYIGDNATIGPGKIELLKALQTESSITAAAKSLNIPYKKAWNLLDALNKTFNQPVFEARVGGKGGGKTELTPIGNQLIKSYEALEKKLNQCVEDELLDIKKLTETQQ